MKTAAGLIGLALALAMALFALALFSKRAGSGRNRFADPAIEAQMTQEPGTGHRDLLDWDGPSASPKEPRVLSPEATRLAAVLEDAYDQIGKFSDGTAYAAEENHIISDMLICASAKNAQDSADAAYEIARRHRIAADSVLRLLESLEFVLPDYGEGMWAWGSKNGKLALTIEDLNSMRDHALFPGERLRGPILLPFIARGSVSGAKRRDLSPYLGQIERTRAAGKKAL